MNTCITSDSLEVLNVQGTSNALPPQYLMFLDLLREAPIAVYITEVELSTWGKGPAIQVSSSMLPGVQPIHRARWFHVNRSSSFLLLGHPAKESWLDCKASKKIVHFQICRYRHDLALYNAKNFRHKKMPHLYTSWMTAFLSGERFTTQLLITRSYEPASTPASERHSMYPLTKCIFVLAYLPS